MSFGKSLSRELGKNTGKYISNKVFGTGHSTPHRVMIERVERKKQREEAREYKLRQKEIEVERRARERELKNAEKRRQEELKLQIIEENTREVSEHTNYVAAIQSVHKSFSERFDWALAEVYQMEFELGMNEEVPGFKELTFSDSEDKIMDFYRKFTNKQVDERLEAVRADLKISGSKKLFNKLLPSLKNTFLDRKFFPDDFNRQEETEDKLLKIESLRETWFNEYITEHKEKYENFLKEKEYYKTLNDLSERIEKKDTQAIKEAISFLEIYKDLEDYGSDLSVSVTPSLKVIVDFYVHDEEVIPNATKDLIRKGLEVREKPYPTTKKNEIYQDYVCSCILKIAKETFQFHEILNVVQVNAIGSILNTSNGNYEEQTIISVILKRSKLEGLNFDLLDPSDSIKNFEHRMDFNKKEGFKPVLNF